MLKENKHIALLLLRFHDILKYLEIFFASLICYFVIQDFIRNFMTFTFFKFCTTVPYWYYDKIHTITLDKALNTVYTLYYNKYLKDLFFILVSSLVLKYNSYCETKVQAKL